MKVSIVGTGYVGLTTGSLLAAAGNKVYCIDVDPKKIDIIKEGKAHFYEPGLDEFVNKAISSKNLIPTLDYKEAIPNSEIAIISVGTPTNPDGSLDLSYVFSAAESIIKHMQNGLIIVQKSTVPVGTGREIMKMIEKSGKKASVVSCPEFLSEGSAVFDTFNLDRLVVGSDNKKAMTEVVGLFKSLDQFSKTLDLSKYKEFSEIYKKKTKLNTDIPFEERVLYLGLESAEMVKITANAYLATKISFANSIARICDKVGADSSEVMEGIGRDQRIGRDFLYPGLGWGGGCFPKDTSGLLFLANENGLNFAQLQATISINESQSDYVAAKIQGALNGDLKNRKIGILGLSYKPGTNDTRESPAVKLANKLIKKGAEVTVFDPEAMEEAKSFLAEKIKLADSAKKIFDGSEAVVLATDWPEFLKLNFKDLKSKTKRAVIIDARNKLDKEELKKIGYTYIGIGR
ncbi:UDP-glucose/GDP-mannose dehydrogenase family protein [Candidatus Dojkabacteria bacterium]|nr:UDP-glucose/GDP-mannose dehydrogenase family protein [Candidatus Dojkabacteria bacterium]